MTIAKEYHTIYLFNPSHPTFDFSVFLLVPYIIQIDVKPCFSALNLFFQHQTMKRDLSLEQIPSALQKHCFCPYGSQAPLCLSREQQLSLGRSEGGLGDMASMSHPGIDVTFLSSGLMEPKKLQIWKTKGISVVTALNVKWERSDREKKSISNLPSPNGLELKKKIKWHWDSSRYAWILYTHDALKIHQRSFICSKYFMFTVSV